MQDLSIDMNLCKVIKETTLRGFMIPISCECAVSYNPINFCYIISLYDRTDDITLKAYFYPEHLHKLFKALNTLEYLELIKDVTMGFITQLNLMYGYERIENNDL